MTNLKYTLIPVAAIAGFGAYVAFHPGIAYAEPRIGTQVRPSQIATTGTYTIDPMHTSIYFEINHMGLSNVHGRFDKFEGKINLGGTDLSKSGVTFTAQTESVNTNVAARDNHLRTADFFEVAKYPTLSFKSNRIERRPGGYVAIGDLTIKDVTKQIRIPFRFFGPLPGGPDQPERVGIIADPIKINRRDYHVNYGGNLPNGVPAVGDEVTIRIASEGTRDK